MKERFFTLEMDTALTNAAGSVGGKLTKDRPEYPESLRTFEERRIDWAARGIFRAVIIQPTFTRKGVDQRKWNFIALAWKADFELHRPQRISHIQKGVKFSDICDNFSDRLNGAIKTLDAITEEDLK